MFRLLRSATATTRWFAHGSGRIVLAFVFVSVLLLGVLLVLGGWIERAAWFFGALAVGTAITATSMRKHVEILKAVESSSENIAKALSWVRRVPQKHWEITPEKRPLELLIQKSLHCRSEVLEGLEAVCIAAAEAIEEAHREKVESRRFITFFGSASLATVDPERRRYGRRRSEGTEDEDRQTPEQVYFGALEAAASDQIRMRRYIRLFSDNELADRSVRVKREYAEWLKNQMYQLSRNQHYRLIHVVRAPTWGSGTARIITSRRLLEITGSGEAGLLFVGEELAESMRRHARESVIGAGDEINKPLLFSMNRPWNQFVGDWAGVDVLKTDFLKPAEDLLRDFSKDFEG